MWFGTQTGGVRCFDGETWQTWTTRDGLADNQVNAVFQDREGHFWFGNTLGVNRFDGEILTTFTEEDGLGHNWVRSIFRDRDGHPWFGTRGGGVSRFDGKTWQTWTVEDGLVNDQVGTICQDRKGSFWFGTIQGVSRFDGKTFRTFRVEDGLPGNLIFTIFKDRSGNLWFATNKGVSRYDGQGFRAVDDLAGVVVHTVYEDGDDRFWFGTQQGVSRLDGEIWTHWGRQDGLPGGRVWAIVQARDGTFWFGTQRGVIRFDGEGFKSYTTKDGLSDQVVQSMLEDRNGHLWFGTRAGGVSRFDGQTFQALSGFDGLGGSYVTAMVEMPNGDMWIATNKGATRFRPPDPAPPSVFVDAVVADARYEGVSELSIPSTVGQTAFEFRAISFKTRPASMVYRYRLKGRDEGWRTTHSRQATYQNLPRGTYTFEVVAVDRDLAYSKTPATVMLTVHPPYGILGLASGLIVALLALGIVSGYAIKRRRELFAEMASELQTAHDLQMGLMPEQNPWVEGFSVAGRCLPAAQVGGDFFQYFEQDGKLVIALTDVTGHGMEAAIPAVMFSGVLKNDMEQGGVLEERFERLNRSIYGSLADRTFVTLVMGELDVETGRLVLADCGCPYPYHYRAFTGEVVELEVDAFPLGVRPDAVYRIIETVLKPGDRVVFCSDGLVEARNGSGERFGFDRTGEVVREVCGEGLSAGATVEQILEAVGQFQGEEVQLDDMTCVVVEAGSQNPAQA